MLVNVCVVEANDVPAMDSNGLSDPYCKLYLSSKPGEVGETKIIHKTLTPRWNETFQFKTHKIDQSEKLIIRLKDHDFKIFGVKKTQFISELKLNLSDFEVGKVYDKWFYPVKGKGVPKGSNLHLRIHICTENDKPFIELKKAEPDSNNQQVDIREYLKNLDNQPLENNEEKALNSINKHIDESSSTSTTSQHESHHERKKHKEKKEKKKDKEKIQKKFNVKSKKNKHQSLDVVTHNRKNEITHPLKQNFSQSLNLLNINSQEEEEEDMFVPLTSFYLADGDNPFGEISSLEKSYFGYHLNIISFIQDKIHCETPENDVGSELSRQLLAVGVNTEFVQMSSSIRQIKKYFDNIKSAENSIVICVASTASANNMKIISEAYNETNFLIPDIDGLSPDKKIFPDMELGEVIKNPVDLYEINKKIGSLFKISHDYDRYIFNYLYAIALSNIGQKINNCLFIETPLISTLSMQIQVDNIIKLLVALREYNAII